MHTTIIRSLIMGSPIMQSSFMGSLIMQSTFIGSLIMGSLIIRSLIMQSTIIRSLIMESANVGFGPDGMCDHVNAPRSFGDCFIVEVSFLSLACSELAEEDLGWFQLQRPHTTEQIHLPYMACEVTCHDPM